jgi:hypothetical protein
MTQAKKTGKKMRTGYEKPGFMKSSCRLQSELRQILWDLLPQ